MPNQLSIPFKKTYAVPLKQAVQDHIQARHPETSPHAFQWDIARWESFRKEAISGGAVHVDRIEALTSYHAQLVFILTKLPADSAAGVLSYLASSAVPKLKSSLTSEELPIDLTESFIKALESLMLAQAQECVWQRAIMGAAVPSCNGIIARLSAQASSLYNLAFLTIRDASPSTQHVFPTEWLRHLETKALHFQAAAQYRKAMDDLDTDRYGHEIGRLQVAQSTAKRGYDIARRGNVSPAVLQDIKSLLEIVETNLTRAERDNDLIYHKDVPSVSALPTIQPASMVESLTPAALLDPKDAIGSDEVIFGSLLSHGARVAIEIYNDRRQNYLKDEISGRAQLFNDIADETLRALNLPASLDALEKPIGLPPSLLKKAEEVRLEDGPRRIEKLIEDVQMLAQRDTNILNEARAMDILDGEAEEDENARRDKPVERPPSHEANRELTDKAQGYQGALAHAQESDEAVRQRWHEWETNIVELTWDEARLEASVPSSTVTPYGASRSSSSSHMHARKLRQALEQLDDLSRARKELVRRAELLADADDVQPRILKAAASVERWTEVHASMFDDILDEELVKFEKFHHDIVQGGTRQEELLDAIKVENEAFLLSRKDDPSVREREHALQSLDLAYHKYKELIRHLDEGFQFYNSFAGILMSFKESCKDWTRTRRDEIHSLSRSVKSMTLQPQARASPPLTPASPPAAPSPPAVQAREPPTPARTPKPARHVALDLPPPDSGDWQALDLPPPPPSSRTTPAKKRAKKPMRA
ncbi:hypothetical protein EWM64_g6012 [Hericium alpestre]|uniref:BRO1 domain-containing protein n=1 Tax=Hericium alpestre TaxID=135208 RepID=A0A4Y9ZWX1_9AGAM|nr:hypothetical protein EWM64_g6012 [Hericium alpestre]